MEPGFHGAFRAGVRDRSAAGAAAARSGRGRPVRVPDLAHIPARSSTPNHDGATGAGERARIGARARIRYGLVLLLLAGAFTLAMVAPAAWWGRIASVLMEGGALLVVLAKARADRRILAGGMGAAAAATGAAVWAAFGGSVQGGVADLASAALLALIPVAVVIEFRRNLSITVQSVTASVCIYVVLGMLFAAVASAASGLAGVPYFTGHATATSSDYTYFSFVTLATIGYGDLVPATHLGQSLAVVEGLSGQVYLVTVVALVVGNLGFPRR